MGNMRLNAIAILLLATALMLSGCVREVIKEVEVPVEKVVTATPTATSDEPAPTPEIEAKAEATNNGSELGSAMKEELLKLANNRDAWFLKER